MKFLSDGELSSCYGGNSMLFGQTLANTVSTYGGIAGDPYIQSFPPPSINGLVLGKDLQLERAQLST